MGRGSKRLGPLTSITHPHVPCIPADWDGFDAVRRWRNAEYRIHVENPGHVEKGVSSIEVDGERVDHIPVFSSGAHDVRVVMG